jgi:hypothetical protein
MNTVLIIIALLIVGSAIWGWRGYHPVGGFPGARTKRKGPWLGKQGPHHSLTHSRALRRDPSAALPGVATAGRAAHCDHSWLARRCSTPLKMLT